MDYCTYVQHGLLFRAYKIKVCAYEIVIRTYEIVIRTYDLVNRTYELLNRAYDLIIFLTVSYIHFHRFGLLRAGTQIPRWLLCTHSSQTQKIWLSRSDTLVCLCTLHAQSSSFRFQELTHILMS